MPDKKKTKIVEYEDEQGLPRLAELPADADDDEAPMGVPAGFDVVQLNYPEPFSTKIYEALWEMGFRTKEDFLDKDALTNIRRAVQNILRMEANEIRNTILNSLD